MSDVPLLNPPPSDAAATRRESSQFRVHRQRPAAPQRPGTRPRTAQHVHRRHRPTRGLHHLVYEVVDNSIDEAMAGFAKTVSVIVHTDGSVTVEDDGRGIPVDRHEQLSEELDREVSTLEGVMTVLKFGGKFEKGAYQTSGGLHGVGVTVVNFLSQWGEVEVSRDGFTWTQEYERGVPTGSGRRRAARPRRPAPRRRSKPTRRSFTTTKFSFDTLLQTTAGTGVSQQRRAHQIPG